MKNIYLRTKQIAEYMLEKRATIRSTAKVFGMAKSTVHHDIQKRLPAIDKSLYNRVQMLLDENYSQKNIRGGQATKRMYLNLNKFGKKQK